MPFRRGDLEARAIGKDLVESRQILGALAQIVEVDIVERIGFAVVEPPLVAVSRRDLEFAVFFAAQIPEHIELRAAKVEPGKITGHQRRAGARDIGGLDDHP